jgi:hypothetical protein
MTAIWYCARYLRRVADTFALAGTRLGQLAGEQAHTFLRRRQPHPHPRAAGCAHRPQSVQQVMPKHRGVRVAVTASRASIVRRHPSTATTGFTGAT